MTSGFLYVLFRGLWMLLKGVLILCLILVSGIILFFALFNLNSFKTQIETGLTKAAQQKITIKGDVDIGWDQMRPSLTLDQVSLPKTGVTIDDFEISFPMMDIKNNQGYGAFISVDGLRHPDFEIEKIRLPMRMGADNNVVIEGISGRILDGKSSGKFSYKNNKLSLDLKVKKADYKRVLEGVTGQFDISTNLTSKGSDKETLLKNLNGRFAIMGDKGEMSGSVIDLWATSILTSMLPGGKDTTEMSCLMADFNITNGVAVTKNIVLDTKNVLIRGKGQIDFVAGTIDMILKPHPKDPSLLNLATPMHVTGALDNPSVTPDAGAVVGKLGSVVLGVVNPATLVLSLGKLGAGADDPCAKE